MDYKEKLEKAKELYPTANADQRYVLESLFPELKESKDEKIRKTLLESFEYQIKESHPDKEWVCGIKLKEIIAWLKSLRPQNNWKPSEEQMEALAEALSLAKNCGEESAFDLRTLYEQLKKLKGE